MKVLLFKVRMQTGLLVLYVVGILSWSALLVSAILQGTPLQSLKSDEGVGLLLLLLFGTLVLLVRGFGRLTELAHNRRLLMEYWMKGTRITEDHDAWQRYKQLSAVDKIDSKLG